MAATITFDKPSYTKGDTITVTISDPSRAPIPAGPDTSEAVTFSDTLASGQIVNGTVNVVTPGTPAVAASGPGSVTVTGGRTAALKSDDGIVAVYTTVA